MKAMTVINAVQMFMLLWGFTAVCQADAGGCSLRCNDVNETVGKEVIFACSLPEQFTEACVTRFKFLYPERFNNPKKDMCKHELPDGTCEKRSIFTCRYTPDHAMNETFSFYVQTRSGQESKQFAVNITEAVTSPAPKTEAPGINEAVHALKTEAPAEGTRSPFTGGNHGSGVIPAGVGCFVIFIIIITLTIIIIYKKHPGGFLKRRKFQAVKQNDVDNNKTENV